MPILNVKNWPSQVAKITIESSELMPITLVHATLRDNEFKRHLAQHLRERTVDANVPGIDHVSKVSVSFDHGRVLEDDRVIIIEVTGIFKTPQRTREDFDRLAMKLKNALKAWNKSESEIFVYPFDPNEKSFDEYRTK